MYRVRLKREELEELFPLDIFPDDFSREIEIDRKLVLGYCNCKDCPYFFDCDFKVRVALDGGYYKTIQYGGICAKSEYAVNEHKIGICS